jgi:hypothetical protein
VTPEQLAQLKGAVMALDEEYWGGSDTSVHISLNVVEDLLREIRTTWPRRES